MTRLFRKSAPAPSRPFIVPVSWPEALAWAQGRREDVEMMLQAPLVPQAVFILDLPSREAWRETLALTHHWQAQGAVCAIFRTNNPIVRRYAERRGALPASFERATGKIRYFVPPDIFKAWMASQKNIN